MQKLGLEQHSEVDKASFRGLIAQEFVNIVHSLEPSGNMVIPFHIKHIDYSQWNTKSEDTKIKLLGADDYLYLANFYKTIDEWNEFMSSEQDPTEIYSAVTEVVISARKVFTQLSWLRTSSPAIDQVLVRLEGRFHFGSHIIEG